MNVRVEYRGQLADGNADFGEHLGRSASGVELQQDVAAVIFFSAVGYECACACLPAKHWWAAFCPVKVTSRHCAA